MGHSNDPFRRGLSQDFLDRLYEHGYPAYRALLTILSEMGSSAPITVEHQSVKDLAFDLVTHRGNRLGFEIDGLIKIQLEDETQLSLTSPFRACPNGNEPTRVCLDPRKDDYVKAGRILAGL